MNRFYVNLYLDEDVNVLIAKLVRSRGYSGLTTVEAGQTSRSDAEQLAFATLRQMTILTHNRRDFEELAREYHATGKGHCGIIIAVRRPPHEIARRLLIILDDVTADEMANQVLYI